MTHAKLIARLSNLEGPHGLTGKELYDVCRYNLGSDEALGLSKVLERALNGSIDAAVSLAERVLPGWQGLYLSTEWTGTKSPGNGIRHSAQLRKTVHGYISADGEGANLAIALCIALLCAKEASK